MEALHQKNLFTNKYNLPVNIFTSYDLEFPPHWHESMEIIYILDEHLNIGLNNSVYTLAPGDIFIVGKGEVHYFLLQPVKCSRLIIQLELSVFEDLSNYISSRRIVDPYIPVNHPMHSFFEKHIKDIQVEIELSLPGFEFIIGARLYDIAAGLIRYIPTEKLCSADRSKQLKKLEMLDNIFKYIDNNYREQINLSEVAKAASFSMYHFTRFFKEATGMTFWQYLNNYRVSKAVNYLLNTSDSISDIAYNSGFNSIKTFNRVFRQIKGYSPSQFKKISF